MKQRINLLLISLSQLLLSIPAAQAASVPPGDNAFPFNDSIVYAETRLFRGTDYFTDRFHIETAGHYRAILTDFAFPNPLGETALNITTASTSLGSLYGPGTLLFEATPGEYFVSFFSVATPFETARAQRFRRADERRDGDGVKARRYTTGDDDRSHRYRNAAYRPAGTRFELNLGQYGIEISHLTMETVNSSVIPVPAAIWLFASGLAGLTSLAAARRRRG